MWLEAAEKKDWGKTLQLSVQKSVSGYEFKTEATIYYMLMLTDLPGSWRPETVMKEAVPADLRQNWVKNFLMLEQLRGLDQSDITRGNPTMLLPSITLLCNTCLC